MFIVLIIISSNISHSYSSSVKCVHLAAVQHTLKKVLLQLKLSYCQL